MPRLCVLSRCLSRLLLGLGLVLATASVSKAAGLQLPVFQPGPRVSVLTFGPGDDAFLRFGHNALRVVDPVTRKDVVFNFGTFRYDNPLLILDFLTGKFQYWLSVGDFQTTVAAYRADNRSVTEQVLNLGDQQARELADQLWQNARPENRSYLYDYYRDNCSTRVRDAIDVAMRGALQPRFADAVPQTLRDHTLRSVAGDFWLYVGLDIAMGAYIDQPETQWSEMFLPEKLSQGLDALTFTGVHGTASMIKERKELYKAKGRKPIPRNPPKRTWQFFQGGVAVGAAFAFLGWEAYRRRQRWAHVCLSGLLMLLGLCAGTLGWLFVGLWGFTNHQVAYRNENILQCAPWAIALTWLGWGVLRNNPRAIQLAYQIVWAGLLASGAGLVAKLLPFMVQHNERIIAFALPVWAGAFAALHFMRLRSLRPLLLREETGSQEDAAEPSEDRPRPSRRPSRPPEPEAEEEPTPTAPPEPAPA